MIGGVSKETLFIIDVAAAGPVVIYGTPPPDGRDLDLVTAPVDAESIGAALSRAGFVSAGRHWARIQRGRVELIELVSTKHWGVSGGALAEVAESGRLLTGCSRIIVPSPADQLLFLARRLAKGGRLDARRRSRIAALATPTAWQIAAAHAPAWGLGTAVAALRKAHDSPSTRATSTLASMAELLMLKGQRWPHAAAAVQLAVARRPARGRLVAFSGLDGAGKSSRVLALQATLEDAGYDVASTWNRLGTAGFLHSTAAPVKNVLGRLARRPIHSAAPRRYAEGFDSAPDPARSLRERSEILTYVWSLLVTIVYLTTSRTAIQRERRRHDVVLADRYLLDSLVHLHYRYGDRPFRLQRRLMLHGLPRASLAFLVDVPPEEAVRRKSEQYDINNLSRQNLLYRKLAPTVGAMVVDGMRPPEDVDTEIATTVWRALHEPGRGSDEARTVADRRSIEARVQRALRWCRRMVGS